MSERYSRLFALPNDLYATGSPVVIAAGALLKDNQTGKVLAQLKLRSISSKQIKAVKVCITSMDTVGRTLGEAAEHQYLDLNISRDAEFGQKAAIALPDSSTRSFSATIEEVVFADNTIWTSSNASWQPLPRPTQLASEIQDGELVKQYQLTYGKQCQFSPLSHDDLWFCSCGAVNRAEEGACHSCHLEYTRLRSVQWDALKEAAAVRLAEEKAYAEKQAAERAKREAEAKVEEEKQQAIAQQKAKKTKRIIAICAAVSVVLCAVFAVITQIIIPEQQNKAAYEAAMAAFSAGEYEDAVAKFTVLGDYKDSADKVLESKYYIAIKHFEAENFSEAEQQFRALGDYKDSVQQAENAKNGPSEKRYKQAMQKLEAGNLVEAKRLFLDLGNYKDSATQYNEIRYNEAMTVLKTKDYDKARRLFSDLGSYKDSAEQLKNIDTIKLNDRYDEALAEYTAENYYKAHYLFSALNGHRDSTQKAEDCLSTLYEKASSALQKRDYSTAYSIFVNLSGNQYIKDAYKDSLEKKDLCLEKIFSSVSVGDSIVFGAFDQDDDIGKQEPIEWIVLEKRTGQLRLISKYAISKQEYYWGAFTDGRKIAWVGSELRDWLNSYFVNLLEDDAKYLSGNSEVTILSTNEVKQFFPTENSRKTYYSYSDAPASWWTASDDLVEFTGKIGRMPEYSKEGVRPVIWVNID